jgi:hypothetical protein
MNPQPFRCAAGHDLTAVFNVAIPAPKLEQARRLLFDRLSL